MAQRYISPEDWDDSKNNGIPLDTRQMPTEHTTAAVTAYARINTALCTLRVMLEQENVQHARQPDVTALECVATSLERIEDQWTAARQIADADRQLADAADERATVEDVRYGRAL